MGMGSVDPQQSCMLLPLAPPFQLPIDPPFAFSFRTAYVMCKTGLSHEDAFTFVQTRRFCVAPRIEFQHQLQVRLDLIASGNRGLLEQTILYSTRRMDQCLWLPKLWLMTRGPKLDNEIVGEGERNRPKMTTMRWMFQCQSCPSPPRSLIPKHI